MSEYKETAVTLVQKEYLAFLKDDTGFVDHIVDRLSSGLAERIMGILDREGEIVVRQSDLRVSEYTPTNSVEYRRQINWSPLVRCKECRWRHDDSNPQYLPCTDWYPQDDFFCAYGERSVNE